MQQVCELDRIGEVVVLDFEADREGLFSERLL